jgi:ribosome maturation protein SDO1
MVTLDDAIIAKIEKDGKHFEILVDPLLAYDLKEGKSVSVQRMLAVNVVFTDAKKGDRAPISDVRKYLGTDDVEKIAVVIVKEGDTQLTTDFRRKKVEEKRKQIAAFISKFAINPQTRLPHPQDRILTVMEQARVQIDPFKPADQQVDGIIKAIKMIIPLSMEELTLFVEIPAKYSSRAYGILKEYNVHQDRWLNDGSLSARITIPAGMKENVFRRIEALCEGGAKIEEVKR